MMNNHNLPVSAAEDALSVRRWFTGQLADGENYVDVTAQISLDETGEVVFSFDPIPVADETAFLFDILLDRGERPATVQLAVIAKDGTRFDTDSFHVQHRSIHSDAEGDRFTLSGVCLTGTFRRPLKASAVFPIVRLHLRGYQGFGSHEATCPLGDVVIAAHGDDTRTDMLSGSISLRPKAAPEDFVRWRADGERLLEHIRRVMSFAASWHLRAPIFEFYHGEEVEVRVSSQTPRATGALPTIHRMQQETIFVTSVESFFHPPIPVRQLFYTIEWFTMETTYNEVRLMCAMTALENLLNANLAPSNVEIQDPKTFKKTRSMLRRVIRRCVERWPAEQAGEVLDELGSKLGELNRRSFYRKLKILASRWGVPLDDIPQPSLKAAIRARDRVVHRGQYYEERRAEDPDLWAHVTLVREVVARFLFTAIGYRGDYISYVGRAHDSRFEPTTPF